LMERSDFHQSSIINRQSSIGFPDKSGFPLRFNRLVRVRIF